MVKYKKQFQSMIDENSNLFSSFEKAYENYSHDEEVFNEIGTTVMRVIRRYENALCAKSENSGYGKFSSNLSDKFWEEIRTSYPYIDKVKMQ